MAKQKKADVQQQPLLGREPERQTGKLQHLAGSTNDDFNHTTINQALNALWVAADPR